MDVSETVRAAGGVVWRRTVNGGIDVLLVHRAGRQDWTLPKGKVEPGETEEACAVREVQEETSLLCTLGTELGTVSYRDQRGRAKTVRYWSMEAVDGAAAPQHEVDAVRWIPLVAATDELTYPRDRALLASCARQIIQSAKETA
jgi:8-oxo-dGTP pyrophosphatase MutT (NUDIX family)